MSQAEGSRRRIRLDLGYRGTDFHGWARQPEARTVQGLIEAGLETICGTPVRTARFMAGRVLALVEHPAPRRAEDDEPAGAPVRPVRAA